MIDYVKRNASAPTRTISYVHPTRTTLPTPQRDPITGSIRLTHRGQTVTLSR